jgi:uncharacterized protein
MPDLALSVVVLGVSDFTRSVAFYEGFGLVRKVRATGDEIAFFDAGGAVLAVMRWDLLAEDAVVPAEPRPQAFRGVTFARNCGTVAEVDELFARALKLGARSLKQPQTTAFGGYSGYFADPDGHAWEVVHVPNFPVSPDGRVHLPD